MKITNKRQACTIVIAMSIAGSTALGGLSSWNYDGSDNWSNGSRWTGSIPANPGDSVFFTNNITANRIITVDGTPAIGDLTIGAPDGIHSFEITGSTLNFSTGGASATLTQTANSQSNTISAPLQLNNNLVVTNNSTNALVLSGSITGSKTFTKYGPGMVVLATSNDLNTIVREGTLRMDTAKSLAGSFNSTIYSNAVLLFNNTPQCDWFGGTLNNGGTFMCSGTSSCSVGNNGFTVASDATGTISTVSASDVFTFGGNTGLAGGNTNSLFIFSGPGTIVLNKAATSASPFFYYGSHLLSSGTVRIQHPNALAALTNRVTLAGGILEARISTNADCSLGGYFALAGDSTLLMNRGSAGPGFQYTIQGMEAGTNRTFTLQAGSNVTSGVMTTLVSSLILKSDVVLNVTNGTSAGTTLILPGIVETNGSHSITKTGNGTLVLNGTNSFSGNFGVTNGILDLQLPGNGTFDDRSSLSIASGTTVNLVAGVMETVQFLSFDGQLQIGGRTWGSPTSSAEKKSAFFTGNGLLMVTGNNKNGTVLLIK